MSRCLGERCDQYEKDVANKDKKPKRRAQVKDVRRIEHEFDFESAKILRNVRTRGVLKLMKQRK